MANRLALFIASLAIRTLMWGDHTFVYMHRVREIQREIDEMRQVYFGIEPVRASSGKDD